MKKPILILLLMQLCLHELPAQLVWQNPKPSGFNINHISFINASTGFLMNQNGELFTTRDTGNTWQKVRRFQNTQTMRLANGTGIIPTVDGLIFISKDNGSTWVRQNNGSGNYSDWADIVGRDTLFLLKNTTVSNSKALYRSLDRGLSWTEMNNNLSLYNLKTLDFITANIGYGTRADGVYRTVNGGVSWSKVYAINSTAQITSMKFQDSLTGYAYREVYGILKTTDGGVTWNGNNNSEKVVDFFILSPTNVFAVGEYGFITRTTDGGNTWTNITPTSYIAGYDLSTCYFFDENKGIAAGLRGRIIKTHDAGNSWKQHSPTYFDMTTIAWPDSQYGYVTNWTNVYKTTDGGANWNVLPLSLTITSPDYSRFQNSYFWHRDSGMLAVGSYARIYRTTDGGQHWTFDNLSPFSGYEDITGMSFPTKDTGYISVYAITGATAIFKTNDRGLNWQQVNQYGGHKKIQFVDTRHGFSLRNNNIQRTRDGGVSWTELSAPSNSGINTLFFLNPAKGFIAGEQGYFKMTADSGNTWVNIEVPTTPSIYQNIVSVRFLDNMNGFMTNSEGYIYQTTNAGTSWKITGRAAYNSFKEISFRKDSVIFFTGTNGSIISTDLLGCEIEPPVALACGRMLGARVNVALSVADSIYFEYGKHDFSNREPASPAFSVDNNQQDVTAFPPGLEADSVYQVRVRVTHRGIHKYSDVLYYIPNHPPTPVITASGNILSSSAPSGNQWYFNNAIINGATAQQYTATATGTYQVMQLQGAGCYSYLSAGYNLTITAVGQVNPLANEIIVFPNPVSGEELTVKVSGGRRSDFLVTDLTGRITMSGILNMGNNTLLLKGMSRGIYLLQVTDPVRHYTYTFKISKQ